MKPRPCERNYYHFGFYLRNNSYLFGERISESSLRSLSSSNEIDSFRVAIVGSFF